MIFVVNEPAKRDAAASTSLKVGRQKTALQQPPSTSRFKAIFILSQRKRSCTIKSRADKKSKDLKWNWKNLVCRQAYLIYRRLQ